MYQEVKIMIQDTQNPIAMCSKVFISSFIKSESFILELQETVIGKYEPLYF